MPDRLCVMCQQPIPKTKRTDSKVCSGECKRRYAADKTRRWALANPERVQEARARRPTTEAARQTQREARLRSYHKRRAEDPALAEYRQRSQWLRRYGITVEDYDVMLEAQNGVCAVCLGSCSLGKRLAVDHNHETGEVRGLLCFRCNSAMAVFDAEPGRLDRVRVYLARTA